jgi:hypothetical protein
VVEVEHPAHGPERQVVQNPAGEEPHARAHRSPFVCWKDRERSGVSVSVIKRHGTRRTLYERKRDKSGRDSTSNRPGHPPSPTNDPTRMNNKMIESAEGGEHIKLFSRMCAGRVPGANDPRASHVHLTTIRRNRVVHLREISDRLVKHRRATHPWPAPAPRRRSRADVLRRR